jgi:hypothetical protein
MSPSILFLVFPLFFWVVWFIYDWQGFIIISFGYAKDGLMNVRGNVRDECPWECA